MIGQRIRHFRGKRKMSIRGLTYASGVSPAFICQIEAGKSSPTWDKVLLIANALHMPLDTPVLFDQHEHEAFGIE